MRFEMTDEELEELYNACKPAHYLVVGGREPISPREAAMWVWKRIAQRVKVNIDSIRPSHGGDRFFEAEPEQTEGGENE